MNVGEFLRLAKEVHDARPPLGAPIVLLDEMAEVKAVAPFVIVESDEPVPASISSVLPLGSIVLRVARFEPPKLIVEAAP